MVRLFIVIILFLSIDCFGQETCSRIAVVNYQEILVDTSTNARGEGLRYYLEKDPKAVSLLDEYQSKNGPHSWNTAASTAGSLMVLAGLLHNDASSSSNSPRNTLIYGGIFVGAVSYLVLKTRQYNNEKVLKQAVDQYNKRNQPHIYFSPYSDNNSDFGMGVGVTQEF